MKKRILFLTVMTILCATFTSCALFKKECEHSYTEKVVAPTCAAEGYTEHTCSKCNASYKDVPTQKVAHPYKNVVVSPTCAEEGYTEHTCTVCGDSYKDAKVAKVSHDYKAEIIAPNCAEEGYTKHTCSACGDSYKDTVTAKTAHRFNGGDCKYCDMEEITENIAPDTEWFVSGKSAYLISTPEQLAGFAALVNSGCDFTNKSIYLDSDIDLGYYEWIPIGTEKRPFTGTFSGEGYTITGLKINATSSYVGLFGYSTGKITNLDIVNATVYSSDSYWDVSIACGYSEGEIFDVSVSGYVDAKLSKRVAGIVGHARAAIKNCTNNAEIVADCYVGGIAGRSMSDIAYCTNNGNISGKSLYVGGIVGELNSTNGLVLNNLVNSANVSGASSVGGIVGQLYQETNSSSGENYENVAQSGDTYTHYKRFTTTIKNVENLGDVSASGENAGGIFGYVYVEATYAGTSNCCNRTYKCNIICDFRIVAENMKNVGTVNAYESVGELIGFFSADLESTVTAYTVTGAVSVNGEVEEGIYDVGSNTNLTLSGREVYAPDDGENTETP